MEYQNILRRIIFNVPLLIVCFFFSGFAHAELWNEDSHTVWEVDYNSDGRVDLILRGTPRHVNIPYDIKVPLASEYGSYVLQKNVDGSYTVISDVSETILSSLSLVATDYSIQVGDFNGDGEPDYFLYSPTKDALVLHFGDSGTNLEIAQVIPAADFINVKSIKIADIDGDGRDDLVLVEESDQRVASADSSGQFPSLGGSDGSDVAVVAGSASVSQQGSARYSIPLNLPEGVGGLKPSLSLSYDSNGSVGLLGKSWSLTGLQSISRCRPTYATEGYAHAKPFTTQERYCLNGSKLVSVSGVYGANNTQYRTEQDQFIKVVSYGVSGNGPASFKAWTKNGLILEFGNSSSARLIPSGTSTVSNWALNKVTDLFGNTYNISYTNSAATGEQYPSTITYAPSITIQLNYETRGGITGKSDTSWRFKGGFEFNLTKRLKSIETKKSGANIRKYELVYENSPTTGRSRITQVNECAYQAGGSSVTCAKPTQFTWQNGEQGFEATPSALVTSSRVTGRQPVQADMNGDGYLDLVWANENRWWIAEGYQGGFRSPKKTYISTGATGKYAGVATPIRIGNGNRWGLIVVSRIQSGGTLEGNNGTYSVSELFSWRMIGFEPSGSNYKLGIGATVFNSLGNRPQVGDYNGDGRQDLLLFIGDELADVYDKVFADESVYHDYNNKALGFENATNTMVGIQLDKEWAPLAGETVEPSNKNEIYFYGHFVNGIYSNASDLTLYGATSADVNGDGLQDVLARQGNYWVSLESYRDGAKVVADWNYDRHKVYKVKKVATNIPTGDGENGNGTVTDLNRDGLPDMMVRISNRWHAYINRGNSFTHFDTGITSTGDADKAIALDYDSDGQADLLINDGGRWKVITANIARNSLSFTKVDIHTPAAGYYGDTSGLSYALKFVDEGEGPLVSDTNGDGLTDILFYESGSWKSVRHKNVKPDMLTRVTTGMGHLTEFTFKPLTDTSTYTFVNESAFPSLSVRGAGYVVNRLKQSNGVGGLNTKTYKYSGAKVHVQGRGFLGFSQQEITDTSLGTVTTANYRQDYPYIGALLNSTVKKGGFTLSATTNIWSKKSLNGGKTVFPYLQASISQQHEANGILVAASKTTRGYDSYGNLTSETMQTGKGVTGSTITNVEKTVSVSRQYNSPVTGTNAWRVGFLNKETTSSGGLTDVTTYTPWGATLAVGTVTQHQGSGVSNTASYTRDGYGNVTSTSVSASGAVTRIAEQKLNFVDNLYPQVIKNAKGHSQTVVYDTRLGLPVQSTDANGLVSNIKYDAWGRQAYQKDADGTTTSVLREWCTTGCPANAKYKITTLVAHSSAKGLGQAPSTVYFDQFDRQLRSVTRNLDGKVIHQDTLYDSRGRVTQTSLPYFAGSTPKWSVYSNYDILGRPGKVSNPDGSSTTFSYSNDVGYSRKETRTHTIKKPNGSTETQSTTRFFDSLGQLKKVNDAAGTPTTFTYDGFGRLKTTKVNGQSETSITVDYDIAGNKTKLIDPDAGVTTYSYDGLGQMLTQTDANAQTSSFKYDTLGRMTQRIDNAGTYNWVYDSAANGVGLLAEINGPDIKETYQYDVLSRMSHSSSELLGESPRTFSYSYDQFSRPSVMTYPSEFGVKNEYNSLGYLVSVESPTSDNQYWSASEADVFGNITSENFGNGATTQRVFNQVTGFLEQINTEQGAKTLQKLTYSYDTRGNVYSRTAEVRGLQLSERFGYDVMNRLTSATTSGLAGGERVLSYGYDALGNITYKSGVSDVGGYKYENGRPHAVSSITNEGITTTLDYDDNGNVIRSGNRQLTYNAINKPTLIKEGTKEVSFKYGPEGERFYQERKVSGQLAQKTYYLAGGAYEEVVDLAKNEIKRKSYVSGLMVHISTKPIIGGFASSKLHYIHTDALGSTDVITDSLGKEVERFAFDPFGMRRQDQWQDIDYAYRSLLQEMGYAATTRGFTGHEHLDDFDLIHMNGRVYDPVIGRFLSPDVIVQAPHYSQSYNRYSYGWNNPLSGTDPSGYIYESSLIDLAMDNYWANQFSPQDSTGWSIDANGLDFSYTYAPEVRDLNFAEPLQNSIMEYRDSNAEFFTENAIADAALATTYVAAAIFLPASSAEGAMAVFPPLKNASTALKNADGIIDAVGDRLNNLSGMATPLEPKGYSVIYETNIGDGVAAIRNRYEHFKVANQNLLNDVNADFQLNNFMETMVPGFRRIEGSRIPANGKSPGVDVTWHHDGGDKLQLVWRYQHEQSKGSPWNAMWQSLFHPNNKGGYSEGNK